MKESGIGRENGIEALMACTYICHPYNLHQHFMGLVILIYVILQIRKASQPLSILRLLKSTESQMTGLRKKVEHAMAKASNMDNNT
jgi:hypothetical protein